MVGRIRIPEVGEFITRKELPKLPNGEPVLGYDDAQGTIWIMVHRPALESDPVGTARLMAAHMSAMTQDLTHWIEATA